MTSFKKFKTFDTKAIFIVESHKHILERIKLDFINYTFCVLNFHPIISVEFIAVLLQLYLKSDKTKSVPKPVCTGLSTSNWYFSCQSYEPKLCQKIDISNVYQKKETPVFC